MNDYSGETSAPVTAAAPDLSLLKSDGGVSVQPGGTIPYTLTYQNKGTWPASGVVITEKVPLWTVFNSAASTPGWTCLPDANAGSTCTYPVPGGVVNPGPAASVIFALTVANPFPGRDCSGQQPGVDRR